MSNYFDLLFSCTLNACLSLLYRYSAGTVAIFFADGNVKRTSVKVLLLSQRLMFTDEEKNVSLNCCDCVATVAKLLIRCGRYVDNRRRRLFPGERQSAVGRAVHIR